MKSAYFEYHIVVGKIYSLYFDYNMFSEVKSI